MHDLTNESREQLYVIFAKLTGGLDSEAPASDLGTPWPTGHRVVTGEQ